MLTAKPAAVSICTFLCSLEAYCLYWEIHTLRRHIDVRVWLANTAWRGAGLGLISPHTDEFGSLESKPSRTREPDSYVYGPPKAVTTLANRAQSQAHVIAFHAPRSYVRQLWTCLMLVTGFGSKLGSLMWTCMATASRNCRNWAIFVEICYPVILPLYKHREDLLWKSSTLFSFLNIITTFIWSLCWIFGYQRVQSRLAKR
jgi:hypothetical protein